MVETLFFAALTPLLPELAREFGLSKTGVGVLSGAYAAGGTVGALCGAWLATRTGLRATTVIGMLVLATCCAGFGLADQVWLLDTLRFAQGAGAAIAWTGGLAWLAAEAPPNRRGELLGIALGAAVTGALLGPLVGGAAHVIGRPVAFTSVAGPRRRARRLGGADARAATADPSAAQPAPHLVAQRQRGLRRLADRTGLAAVRLPDRARAAQPRRRGRRRARHDGLLGRQRRDGSRAEPTAGPVVGSPGAARAGAGGAHRLDCGLARDPVRRRPRAADRARARWPRWSTTASGCRAARCSPRPPSRMGSSTASRSRSSTSPGRRRVPWARSPAAGSPTCSATAAPTRAGGHLRRDAARDHAAPGRDRRLRASACIFSGR